MYPYPQSINPAVRSHIDAQSAFFNELSQTMSRSFQQVIQLNMQLGQTLLEEAAGTAQRMLTAERPSDALSAAAARAQPGTDKLREYQQQLSQLAAATQVDLSRVTEQHGQETSRTARALVDDVSRTAAEETAKGLRQREDAIKMSRDAFTKEAERGAKAAGQYQGNLQSGADAKIDSQAVSTKAPGNVQGNNPQAGNKQSSSPR
ncbi:MAG: phasin family protein [Oxalobacteraceae bacterium]|nr:MAG: phasin family protein [Oxalobacteraceae bacterium]